MSKRNLNPSEVKEMLIAISDKIIESEELLCEADRRLGDGDHGLGMRRGFTAAKAQLEALDPKTVGQVFTTTGITLMSTMGGASGAVMGMLYQSGGMALGDADSLDAAGLSTFMTAALNGVTNLGGAKPGDKTMVDALAAAQEAAAASTDLSISDAMKAVAAGATAGMEATEAMIATMGRAKTLGERSIGHPDPGAVSVSIMFNTASAYVG
jgi:phosphoenolpyruvate---glycerone phosphotransferase subunit DhaL